MTKIQTILSKYLSDIPMSKHRAEKFVAELEEYVESEKEKLEKENALLYDHLFNVHYCNCNIDFNPPKEK